MGFITFSYYQENKNEPFSLEFGNKNSCLHVSSAFDTPLNSRATQTCEGHQKIRSFARYLNLKFLNLTFNLYIFSAWKYLFRDGTKQSKVVVSLQVLLALNLILFTISSYLL